MIVKYVPVDVKPVKPGKLAFYCVLSRLPILVKLFLVVRAKGYLSTIEDK